MRLHAHVHEMYGISIHGHVLCFSLYDSQSSAPADIIVMPHASSSAASAVADASNDGATIARGVRGGERTRPIRDRDPRSNEASLSAIARLGKDARWLARYGKVAGWLKLSVVYALAAVQKVQNELNVTGSILEIGVHHGKFYLALDQVRRDGELGFAIDVTTISMRKEMLHRYSRVMKSMPTCKGGPNQGMCFTDKAWFGWNVHSCVARHERDV